MRIVEPIAIVGIGCRLPGGVRNPDDLWALLSNGVDAVREIPEDRWLASAMYHPDPARPGRMTTRHGGFLDHIDRFDAQFFEISPREAAPADPQQRLLLEVAYEATEDAGIPIAALVGKRAGVYVGISSYDYAVVQARDPTAVDAYSNLGSALCIAANRISYFFNLLGPSLAVDTACSSSLVAVDLGCRGIWSGQIELAFVAGVNVIVLPQASIGFSKASMLAPDGRCKSFDARANGFVRGEGASVVILKPLARALADGDRVYALIRATTVNQDGRTDGISVPNRASQEANLHEALRLANIAPETVQYVEAHGTGTSVGDPIEAAAIGAVYGKARKSEARCLIGSMKTNVGHLEAASGLAGLIKTALCLQHRQIPPSLHFETPNPQIAFDDLQLRVVQRLEPWPETYGEPPRAGVNAFGFGGTNAHAILEAAPVSDNSARMGGVKYEDECAWMLPLSARSAPALPDLARSYLSALGEQGSLKHATLRNICFSAGVKRSHHEFRLALVAHDKAELQDQLDAYLRGEARANSSTGHISGAPSKPVFVCSGMGQQWWAMGRELLEREPVYRRAIEEVNDLFGQIANWSLVDKLTADEKASQIQETRFGQPAIFALQIGLAALWRSWGVEPAAVVGHSAGEMAACCICGALSLEDAVRVTYHRSRLQYRTAGRGTMLAVGIPSKEAARLVERHPQAISIAAINGVNSITLSGDAAVLADIEKSLNEAGMFSRALQVDVPFHSPKMEQLQSELMECLRDIRPRPATTPFFSTVTGNALLGPEIDAQYWYRNIRKPVLFHETMQRIIEAGHRVFLELGAHPILRHDILACLEGKSPAGAVLPSLRRQERERAALLGSLGRLFCFGAEIDWQKLFPSGAAAIKLPAYPFQADRHWRETDALRRLRRGETVHPLLGNRLETAQPIWQVKLDAGDLAYLADHRIGSSVIFPGAGYVEMALAAAQESFGPVRCVVEDIEFQKFLVLDDTAACAVQVALDPESNAIGISACTDSSDDGWELHARGCIRKASRPAPAISDLAEIRRRSPDRVDVEQYYWRLAEAGYAYGPAFRAIAQLWRGEGETFVEIRVPTSVSEQLPQYRVHPVVLDACFQAAVAALPAAFWQEAKDRAYFPVKIDRVRFHAAAGAGLFACAYLKEFNATVLEADIELFDAEGTRLLDVQGLVCRPAEQRAQRGYSTLYEYQWKLKPRAGRCDARLCHHLPSPLVLAPVIQGEGQVLQKRLDRARFQNEFHSLMRAAAAGYIGRALRELGWTPACSAMPIDQLAVGLGLSPLYHEWLRLMLKELSPDELASTEEPARPWKRAWEEFPEGQAELLLVRACGENLSAVLKGHVDPLNLIFPQGELTTTEHLYQDSPTARCANLLAQRTVAEIVKRLPNGRSLRILELGAGTGGMTSFILPVLPAYCTEEYVFTDVSSHFTARAQQRFAQYPFLQCRPLDIERNPLEQGFESHSFDLIIAFDVLHATRDLRNTLGRVRQLLGSGGMLMLGEVTRPWLSTTLVFGLLKGWWLFDDDIRQDGPCISAEQWRTVLSEAGFSETVCIADSPDIDKAQHSLILTRGAQLPESPSLAPQASQLSRTWLVFADRGSAVRPSAGGQLALELRERGARVIEVVHGTEFRRLDSGFTIGPGSSEDLRNLLNNVRRDTPHLDGIVYLLSLDMEPIEVMTLADLVSSARLGCIGVLHLLQVLAATEGLAVDSLWLVTRAAQPLDNRAGTFELAQSPLWGLGRVAATEYKTLRCHLVDLATCSREEIGALAEELGAADDREDEIALHGELKYVHRLVPVSLTTLHGIGRQADPPAQPFRIELQRPGILESLLPRALTRATLKLNEIEIEVTATGLNFKDLMHAVGMIPRDAMTDNTEERLLGLECAGRVVAVGDAVSEFAVGDEVVAIATRSLASHVTVDARFAAHKPSCLSLEQAATVPIAFVTAFYSLHTLGRLTRGERVLIHSAAGGVGLAAVQLALQAGATVFATAGTAEKRALLSALGVPHVMDSRSLAFADEVMELTEGEGVDLVLNSLAGEAIDKNLSILRPLGRYIEIGLVDIYKNRRIGMRPLRENISLFAVDLSRVFDQRPDLASSLLRQVLRRIQCGDLHALPHRVFPVARLVDALRTMAQAKHVGKLIVSIKDAEGLQVERAARADSIKADASYLITGGLGGLGLAVADRLAKRGARHVALVGRNAPSQSAQSLVESLRHRGAEVKAYQADVADCAQMQRVIADVQATMGPLRGIIHAAMVLDDAPIEQLDEERMWTAMRPKLIGAWNLHTLTTDAALDFFVLFSSVTSTIGNPGQANYVAGNAFLDMLAYYRRTRGLSALTVNWGRVGEVGHVVNSPETTQRLDRLGMKIMPLSETLDALDELISSEAVDVTVAQIEWKSLGRALGAGVPARFADLVREMGDDEASASAESHLRAILEADAAELQPLLETYMREHLARAIGTSPVRIDPQQSLRNLGLDSLIALEVRNRISADLGINVPLPKLMQSESISALAAYVAERLAEATGREASSAASEPIVGGQPDISPSGDDAADLLQRIDDMTDEEVERHLGVIETQGPA
jgi:acyl transferase domain-containing protein/NADPH:quinone reductase-like Zn-dependent oxidoreductase/acyl carrier protein